jgi:hypothetical protein
VLRSARGPKAGLKGCTRHVRYRVTGEDAKDKADRARCFLVGDANQSHLASMRAGVEAIVAHRRTQALRLSSIDVSTNSVRITRLTHRLFPASKQIDLLNAVAVATALAEHLPIALAADQPRATALS